MYVCHKCTRSTDIKNTLFSEEAQCGCTQLREGRLDSPRRGRSRSQSASTTKWTPVYRHSLGNTDTVPPWWTLTGTLSPRFFFFFFFSHLITYTNAHGHPCPLTPFRNRAIVKRPEAGAGAGGAADNVSFLADKKPAESRSSGLFCCHLLQLPWHD